MAEYLVQEENLVNLYNFLRMLKNHSNAMNITEFYEENKELINSFLNGSLTTIAHDELTTVKPYCFAGYTDLTEVNIPNLTEISEGMFMDCSSLSNVTLPDGIKNIPANAFKNTAITNINIPSTVTGRIYDYAFFGTPLTSVSGSSVDFINDSAFRVCDNLISVSFPKARGVSNYAFYGCNAMTSVNLSSITSIGSNAFDGCTNLTNFNLSKVTSIGNHAFQDSGIITADLSSLELYRHSSLSLDKGFQFRRCNNLTTVNLGDNVEVISKSMFVSCPSLKSITQKNVKEIGSYAFNQCTSLTDISFAKDVDVIGAYAFYGVPVTDVVLDNISRLESCTFHSCKSLSKVTIPNLKYVDSNCFYNCSLLTDINLEGVISFGMSSFYNTGLTKVDLKSCKHLGQSVFRYCEDLTTVILRSESVVEMSYTNSQLAPFFGCNSQLYIYVPSSLIDSYKTHTYWSTYSSKFRAIEDYPDICGTV